MNSGSRDAWEQEKDNFGCKLAERKLGWRQKNTRVDSITVDKWNNATRIASIVCWIKQMYLIPGVQFIQKTKLKNQQKRGTLMGNKNKL